MFGEYANAQLEKEHCELLIEEHLPYERIRKRKRMPDETSEDHIFQNPTEKYKIQVFNIIIDKTISAIECRFKTHKNLFADISVLDPKKFKANECPENCLEDLSKLLVKHHKTASASVLRDELNDLMRKWEHLKISVQDIYI